MNLARALYHFAGLQQQGAILGIDGPRQWHTYFDLIAVQTL
jgi:hypothetical protein